MTLTLIITAPSDARIGQGTRHEFTQQGGTIGRAAGSSLVLTHNKVSAQHASISFRDGVFYIQDTSRNGVAINSPNNRLVARRPYPLKTGDCILIEPYEIDVSIEAEAQGFVDPFGDDDPFAPAIRAPYGETPDLVSPPEGAVGGEVDPLQFFEPLNKPAQRGQSQRTTPPVDDWHGAHYQPPVPDSDHVQPESDPAAIPQGYNPLAPDESAAVPTPSGRRRAAEVIRPRPKPKPKPVIARDISLSSPVAPAPKVPEVVDGPAPPAAPFFASTGQDSDLGGLAGVLSGAGLHGAAVSPELMRSLGEILRVVVSGLMDVLQARQRIKEEFGMRLTLFRPVDNNPLKFSANVEDALHNLLVKRNTAYLGPVEAFSDAFDDLRDHQLAMLAGMRVAFETMLADFDADRLQEEFDRQLGRVSLPLMPAKMRYWDLFREKHREMAKDPEAAFADLFGEEFARAYEEQFRTLKAQRREGSPETPKS